uniref:Uncharacterized protein n=1 Tax=Anopheles minimus TaxID=112268 RepID=A0A182VSE2_9DIPT
MDPAQETGYMGSKCSCHMTFINVLTIPDQEVGFALLSRLLWCFSSSQSVYFLDIPGEVHSVEEATMDQLEFC